MSRTELYVASPGHRSTRVLRAPPPTQGGLHHGAGTGQELQSRLKGTPTNRLFCASIFREIKIFTQSLPRGTYSLL